MINVNRLKKNIKSTTLVQRAKIAEICGNTIKSNYLYIKAIDVHVPQQTLNA